MKNSEIKKHLVENAFTAKGSVKPKYLDNVPVIKDIVTDTLHFLPNDTRQSDLIKAYINDLYRMDNMVNELFSKGVSVKDIIKKLKLRKDIVYGTLKHHGLMKGFKLNHISLDDYDSVVELYNSGFSVYDIAKRYGTSITPVLGILKKMNIEIRDTKISKYNDSILHLYTDNKNSMEYIAKELGCSVTVVKRVLVENNIDISNHIIKDSILNKAIIEYIDSGVSAVYVADKYGISTSSIYHEMEKRGINRRCSTSYSTTNIEQRIQDLLDEHGIDYIKNDRNVISPYEIDFYIPSFNLGIECNGLYWHSCHRKDKNYHYDKFIRCDDIGIQLLQFWGSDITHKFDIVKSIILNKLKKSTSVYARKCTIGMVDGTTTRKFMMTNHIQGYASSTFNIGLYVNDDLVMMLTAGKSRFDSDRYEIIRVSTKLGMHVIGGFSKLLKYAMMVMETDTITSYCNLLYGNGNVYINNGFTRINDTGVGYFYHKKEIITSRYTVQSKKFKNSISYDSSLSEYDNMINNGYFRCFDAGNRKYIINS